MRLLQYLILLPLLFITFTGYSQYRFTGDTYNRLGIQAGIHKSKIESDNFNFIEKQGYMAGFTTRANSRQFLIVVYGVNFYQFNSGMQVLEENTLKPVEIDFKGTGVQINLFAGTKLIGEYLSIEGGPVLQLNGKWEPEKGKENYLIPNYDLVAGDIADVSKVNFNLAVSVSAGLPGVKLWCQYQHGMSNMFRNLDLEELQNKDPAVNNLKGALRMATAGLVVYF